MAAAAAALVPYRWLILVGLITAAIMEVLDTTIINVALPQMAGNLGATTQEIAWVSTVVHPRERRRAADDGVLHRTLRPQTLPHVLDLPVHRRVVHVRHVVESRRDRALALPSGRRRRGAAVHRAGDAAPDLSARTAGHGASHLPARHHRRADARPHARRLDHRQLHLGLVLLHQHADRPRGGVPGVDVPPRSARSAAPAPRQSIGSDRSAHRRHRIAAVRARGGQSRGLVLQRADHPPLDRLGGCADRAALVAALESQRASGHQASAC